MTWSTWFPVRSQPLYPLALHSIILV